MNTLVMGLYVEGPTDDRFLPVIIQRTAEHILLKYDRAEVTVLEPIVIKKHPDISDRSESILRSVHSRRSISFTNLESSDSKNNSPIGNHPFAPRHTPSTLFRSGLRALTSIRKADEYNAFVRSIRTLSGRSSISHSIMHTYPPL